MGSSARELPWDLVVDEILSRIQTRSLTRLMRSMCKTMKGLLKEERFVEKQRARVEEEAMHVILVNYRLYTMTVDPRGVGDFYNLHLRELNLEEQGVMVEISGVCHYDGLLLCSTTKNELVVWNPCSGQTKWIEPRTRSYGNLDRFALGRDNYNSDEYSYKILRIHGNSSERLIEMYELTSSSWRVAEHEDCDWFGYGIFNPSPGVYLKGSKCCWIAISAELELVLGFVLCFDFATERFSRFDLPFECFPFADFAVMSDMRGDGLSVLFRDHDTYNIEIWTMGMDAAEVVSWTKFMTVECGFGRFPKIWDPFFMIHEQEENKVVVCSDMHGYKAGAVTVFVDGEYQQVRVGEALAAASPFASAFLGRYVPTLAQLPHQHSTLAKKPRTR